MIGVLTADSGHAEVREFFELFKTPWEFYRADRHYEVLIVAGTRVPDHSAELVLLYGGAQTPFDLRNKLGLSSRRQNAVLSYQGDRTPIYGNCLTFNAAGTHRITDAHTGLPASVELSFGDTTFVRIGFDLFREVRHLLTSGQPAIHARTPALEQHISFLRDLIVGRSSPLLEIPPVPEGYNFTACLTHDVDHPRLRNHKWDHTMFGFLSRALAGSAVDLCRRRKSPRQVAANWVAALSLPLVHLGIAKDFWRQFDRYLQIESGVKSTFFVIPSRGDPGLDANGHRPKKRATKYAAAEIASDLTQLRAAGREIGLHGIDAWRDSSTGREEIECISRLTGTTELGVRMHWLYFDEASPVALENAGFSYDSTSGYNGAVGYRAGTTQVFKPLQVSRMLELPLHVMDTALFFPSHMNLSPSKAKVVIHELIENAIRFGGVLTVNWHDRSIAPERLWDDFYIDLLDNLKSRGAWFPTAAQAVSWFRKRRAVDLEGFRGQADQLRTKASVSSVNDQLPGLRVRVQTQSGRVDL